MPDTSGGLAQLGRASSLDYYGNIGSIGNAQAYADRYQVVVGYFSMFSASGDDSAPLASTMITRNSNALIMPYVKGLETTNRTARGLVANHPETFYAFTGDPRGNLMGPVPGDGSSWSMAAATPNSWEMWRAADAWHDVIQVNVLHGDTAFRGAYCDSMSAGPSIFGFTVVHPGTNTPYTVADWSSLAYSAVGGQMTGNAPTNMSSWANGLGSGVGYFGGNNSLLNYFDGGLAEAWLRRNNTAPTAFKTEQDWRKDIDMVIDADGRGKGIWCVVNLVNMTAGSGTPPSFSNADIERWHRFSICSYMLGKGSHSYLEFVIEAGTATEVKPWTIDHEYYTTDLGDPIDNMASAAGYQVAGGCYVRRYENGAVIVNPTSATKSWDTDRDYTLVDGTTVYASSGATRTLNSNTAIMVYTTDTGSPGSNAHAPVIVLNSPASTVDAVAQTISVNVTDAEDNIAAVTLALNGGSPVSMVNSGSGGSFSPLGFSERRFASTFSGATHAAHSWLNLESVYLTWAEVNPSVGVFSWTALNSWIDDAATNGYKVLIRVAPGHNSPTWIYTDEEHVPQDKSGDGLEQRDQRYAHRHLDGTPDPVGWSPVRRQHGCGEGDACRPLGRDPRHDVHGGRGTAEGALDWLGHWDVRVVRCELCDRPSQRGQSEPRRGGAGC
jgi:hypothetical protein